MTVILLILSLTVLSFAGCSKSDEAETGEVTTAPAEGTVKGGSTGDAADASKEGAAAVTGKTPGTGDAKTTAPFETTTPIGLGEAVDGGSVTGDTPATGDTGAKTDVEKPMAFDPMATPAPSMKGEADFEYGIERFAGGPDDDVVFDGLAMVEDALGGTGYDDVAPEPRQGGDPGVLTAGEWNDNKNFEFFRQMINRAIEASFAEEEDDFSLRKGEPVEPIDPVVPDFPDLPLEDGITTADGEGVQGQGGQGGEQRVYGDLFKEWELTPFKRLAIHVTGSDGGNVRNAVCTVSSADGKKLVKVRSDHEGMAYAYYTLFGSSAIPAAVKVEANGAAVDYDVTSADLLDDAVVQIALDGVGAEAVSGKALDLMFVVDTTGSMGDEISYLQVELEDVINRIKSAKGDLDIRLSMNFYRDEGDAYVVRSHPFSSDIEEQLSYLRVEYADGGGDYEEAVEQALEDAISSHDWKEDSIKLMFMVLDAPPHNTSSIRASLADSIEKGMAKGIRIIPVASSGIDKSTEMLLRTFAMTTGGTYSFLTDDSGVGDSHIEPTIGDYDVEKLNDLIVRVIKEYVA